MANPNPSPETRFKPGETPNPLGKTSEQRKAEVKAAEIAAQLRLAILSRMKERIERGDDVEALLTSDALRLFKDSEDRAHGTPKASTELTGADGAPLAAGFVVQVVTPGAEVGSGTDIPTGGDDS